MDATLLAAIKEKAETVHAAGLQNFENGNAKAFAGFENPSLKATIERRFGIFAWYSEITRYLIRTVLAAINSAVQCIGAQSILASIDYPLHSTVNEIVLPEDLPITEINKLVAALQASKRIMTLRKLVLRTKTQNFEFLALDGANVLLLSLSIPPGVMAAREKCMELAHELNLHCQPFPPLWHSTLSRLVEIPESADFATYIHTLLRLKKKLADNPQSMAVTALHCVTAYHFLTRPVRGAMADF